MACGIVPWPGIKLMFAAVEARILNHWTTGEVLQTRFWKEDYPASKSRALPFYYTAFLELRHF